jgi:hypothetical protein
MILVKYDVVLIIDAKLDRAILFGGFCGYHMALVVLMGISGEVMTAICAGMAMWKILKWKHETCSLKRHDQLTREESSTHYKLL